MDERDFFDLLYQQWAKTTGAQDRYWMPEEHKLGNWDIFAMDEEQNRKPVAANLTEADADFITAMHGCLPDLVRRAHQAIDEAERFDCNRDERECRIAELEIENQELREKITELDEMLYEVGR